MADEKITQLPTVTNAAVGAISIIPIVDSTDVVTKSIALNQLDLRWIAEPAVAGTTGEVLTSQGLSPPIWAPQTLTTFVPTYQIFKSGSGTYTTPVGVLFLIVEMVGAGAGGDYGALVGTNATSGTDTTFGTSLLIGGGGFAPGGAGAYGGFGGTGTINSPAIEIVNMVGGQGGTAALQGTGDRLSGMTGGSSYFGGAAAGGTYGGAGVDAPANSGSGGGGGGFGGGPVNQPSGSGGGAGAYVRAQILTPSTVYAYSIGIGGAGGIGTQNGGAGGSGIIIVHEYYQ